MNFITEPWPWYVSGPLISLTMFLLFFMGKTFGVSSNIQTACSMLGMGKKIKYFDIDWKAKSWNMIFILGTIAGGFIGYNYLTPDKNIPLGPETVNSLNDIGVQSYNNSFFPDRLFGSEIWGDGFIMFLLLSAGLLIGFGTRYANGCTSGHAITGLSKLSLKSLVAVIGFFIGGLIMTFLILPNIL